MVTIKLNFVTRWGAKLVGGFEEVRVTKDLKKFEKTLANMLNRGVFLKGSGGRMCMLVSLCLVKSKFGSASEEFLCSGGYR